MNAASTSSLLMALPVMALAGRAKKRVAVGPLDHAVAHFEYGDWARGFEVLMPIADSGEREAACCCLMMHLHGARLFGGSFPATSAQRSRWIALSDP